MFGWILTVGACLLVAGAYFAGLADGRKMERSEMRWRVLDGRAREDATERLRVMRESGL